MIRKALAGVWVACVCLALCASSALAAGAPVAANSPNPANGTRGVTTTPNLSWHASGATSYEVRLGTTNPPSTVVPNTGDYWYPPPALLAGTRYYWQIVAKNSEGSTEGPAWSFTTAGVAPAAAGPPGSPNPADGTRGVTTTPTLSWHASGATSYEIRLGTTNPPPTVVSSTTDYYWYAGLGAGATYYWQIVARNSAGSTAGPVWSFTTDGVPLAAAASPNPADGTIGVTTAPNLSWRAAGATAYDIRFGITNPPPTVVVDAKDYWYPPPALDPGTIYYWQIVAKNVISIEGPVWSFKTAGVAPIRVAAGGDLQAALDAAQPGAAILLEPGATYSGNFILRGGRTGTDVITIRSAAPDAALPGDGTRITPADAAQLPKIVSPNGMPALQTEAGAHHYTLTFLEFPANADGNGELVRLGDGSADQNTLELVPHDLVVDRCYIHGDEAYGQRRGIALNSASTIIVNSYIAEIKSIWQDSQAIANWNGPGPYTITNNYLEAAGENVIFGGADPAIPNLVASDITFRNNYLTKPWAWRGQPWIVKNLFELKNAQRVVVDGNVMENNWLAGQAGFAVLFTVRNQDGDCPWCVVQQVEFTNNIVRHVGSGINILGQDNNHPSQTTNALVIRNNLFDDVSGARYGGYGRFMQIGQATANVTVDHNTVIQDGTSALYAYGTPMPGFVFTNNIVPDNSWAIMGADASPGNGTVRMYFPNPQFANGIFAGSNPAVYPQGNFYVSSMSEVGFVDLAGGNFRLAAGSPFANAATDGTAVGCNIDALNAATGARY